MSAFGGIADIGACLLYPQKRTSELYHITVRSNFGSFAIFAAIRRAAEGCAYAECTQGAAASLFSDYLNVLS